MAPAFDTYLTDFELAVVRTATNGLETRWGHFRSFGLSCNFLQTFFYVGHVIRDQAPPSRLSDSYV